MRFNTKSGGQFTCVLSYKLVNLGSKECGIVLANSASTHKDLDSALLENMQKFQTIFDSSPTAISIVELESGKIFDANAVIAAIKPGVPLRDLSKIAREYINSHGQDLHGEPLGKYFTHGVSHHVGLDVHDATDFSQPLAEGNVITVEPGIYIPDESIGIRIEDMVLVTKDGARLMSGALPRDPSEIEKALGR